MNKSYFKLHSSLARGHSSLKIHPNSPGISWSPASPVPEHSWSRPDWWSPADEAAWGSPWHDGDAMETSSNEGGISWNIMHLQKMSPANSILLHKKSWCGSRPQVVIRLLDVFGSCYFLVLKHTQRSCFYPFFVFVVRVYSCDSIIYINMYESITCYLHPTEW